MRRARLAITFFFLADGILIGSWAARIPAVRREADLSDPELGAALFAMSLGALVAMPLVGVLVGRNGSRPITIAAVIAGSASLFVASLAGDLPVLATALVAFGAAFGATNVAANAQGLELERLYGRSILSSLHAAFSAGGLAGAGLGALAAGWDIGTRNHFAAVAVVLGAGAMLGGRRLLSTEGERTAAPRLVRPPRTLLVLGVAAFFTLLAEGAAADWSAVYLSDSLGTTAAVAALGYTGFSLAMAASRLVGDRLDGRLGPEALACIGGLTAAAGLALALAVSSPPVALAGFAAMGAGIGVVVPVLFRAAGTTPGVPAGSGIAAVSTIGWLGFLAGPPAIGFVAGAVGLRTALTIVVAASVIAALLSGSVGRSRRTGFRGLLFEPRAVLSDLDGVLVDSGAAVERSWRSFAARHGLDADRILTQIHGRRSVDVIRLVASHLDAESEAARLEREQLADAAVRPLPGARELVKAVPEERFAIVTSGSRALAVARLEAAGLPVPHVLVSADDVESGKPNPEAYLRAASLLRVDPAHSLVLEDAPAGVAAGRAAGMTVVAVLTTSDERALHAAHSLVGDLRALLPGRAARRRGFAATGRLAPRRPPPASRSAGSTACAGPA